MYGEQGAPEPPVEGPFIFVVSVQARSAVDVPELLAIFSSHRAQALEQGAKAFIVAKQVNKDAITVFEVGLESIVCLSHSILLCFVLHCLCCDL